MSEKKHNTSKDKKSKSKDKKSKSKSDKKSKSKSDKKSISKNDKIKEEHAFGKGKVDSFDQLVKENKASGKSWYHGLEGKWWWGMTEDNVRARLVEVEKILGKIKDTGKKEDKIEVDADINKEDKIEVDIGINKEDKIEDKIEVDIGINKEDKIEDKIEVDTDINKEDKIEEKN